MSARDLVRLADASEYAITVAVADLLRVAVNPGWFWTHFPAGEYRTGATGARLWRMGLQRGWSDFLLISPNGLLHVLELKTTTGTVRDEQLKFLDAMKARGIPAALVRGVDAAFAQLIAWGAIQERATVTRGRG
jgi:hypothetical protein